MILGAGLVIWFQFKFDAAIIQQAGCKRCSAHHCYWDTLHPHTEPEAKRDHQILVTQCCNQLNLFNRFVARCCDTCSSVNLCIAISSTGTMEQCLDHLMKLSWAASLFFFVLRPSLDRQHGEAARRDRRWGRRPSSYIVGSVSLWNQLCSTYSVTSIRAISYWSPHHTIPCYILLELRPLLMWEEGFFFEYTICRLTIWLHIKNLIVNKIIEIRILSFIILTDILTVHTLFTSLFKSLYLLINIFTVHIFFTNLFTSLYSLTWTHVEI